MMMMMMMKTEYRRMRECSAVVREATCEGLDDGSSPKKVFCYLFGPFAAIF